MFVSPSIQLHAMLGAFTIVPNNRHALVIRDELPHWELYQWINPSTAVGKPSMLERNNNDTRDCGKKTVTIKDC